MESAKNFKSSPDHMIIYENILHEISTPVSIIYSVLGFFEKEPVISAGFFKNLKIAKRNCLHLIKLVNDFKALKNFSTGNIFPHFKRTDIVRHTKDIIDGAKRLSVKKNIDIIFRSEMKNNFAVIDREMYQRIVLNLLSNSIKFTPQNGSIKICLKGDKDYFVLSVKDNGSGIDEEIISSVFERYTTNNKNINRHGTGIGLSIVKNLVSIHNGEIAARNRRNETGSEFIVKIPVNISETSFNDDMHGDIYSENLIQIELSDII